MWLFGAASAAPLVSFVVATVIAGAWADHRGPVRPLQAGMAVFVGSQVLMALAPGMLLFTIGRFGSGIAEALMDVSLTVLLARAMPEELRAKVFAAFAAAWVLPSLLGPPIAGLLTEVLSWRSVFALGVALLPPPGCCCARRCARPTRPGVSRPRQQAGRPGNTAPSGPRHWLPPAWRPSPPGGRCSAGPDPSSCSVRRSWWSASAATVPAVRTVLPAGTLRFAHGIPALVALRGLVAAAFGTAGSLLPLMLTTSTASARRRLASSLTVTGLCWAAGSQVHGLDVVQRRVRPVRRLEVGFALITVGVLGPALTSLDGLPVAAGLTLWGVAGLGMGIVSPTLSTQLLRFAPVRTRVGSPPPRA